MKKPLYTIASVITILLISERALDIFFDIGPFAPKSVKLIFIVTYRYEKDQFYIRALLKIKLSTMFLVQF